MRGRGGGRGNRLGNDIKYGGAIKKKKISSTIKGENISHLSKTLNNKRERG